MPRSNHTIAKAFEANTEYRILSHEEFCDIIAYLTGACVGSSDGSRSSLSILKALVAQSHRYPDSDVASPVPTMKNVVTQIEGRARHRGSLTPGEKQILAILQKDIRLVKGDVVFELRIELLLRQQEPLDSAQNGGTSGDGDDKLAG